MPPLVATRSSGTELLNTVYRSGRPVWDAGESLVDADDAALVRAVRGGSAQGAAALFDRYGALVRRVLARILGPFCDVEDHVQETFLTVFRKLETLRDDEAVRAFVVSVAVRTARGELRRRRVRRILRLSAPEELPDIEGPSGVGSVEAREALWRFFGILDDLDAASRLAFTLRYFEQMELIEVANAVGESLASVKRRLARVVPVVNARVERDPALRPYIEGGRS